MSEAGYGSVSQPTPGETGPVTQPYRLKPRNGAGVAGSNIAKKRRTVGIVR